MGPLVGMKRWCQSSRASRQQTLGIACTDTVSLEMKEMDTMAKKKRPKGKKGTPKQKGTRKEPKPKEQQGA